MSGILSLLRLLLRLHRNHVPLLATSRFDAAMRIALPDLGTPDAYVRVRDLIGMALEGMDSRGGGCLW